MANRDLELVRDDVEEEEGLFGGNFFMMGALAIALVVLIPALTSAQVGRIQSYTIGPPATAANVGIIWIQITSAGFPNELRMVAENSTGAFEQMLLGLTT
jgi:hypothetical protein